MTSNVQLTDRNKVNNKQKKEKETKNYKNYKNRRNKIKAVKLKFFLGNQSLEKVKFFKKKQKT